jgi:hypothetical protein
MQRGTIIKHHGSWALRYYDTEIQNGVRVRKKVFTTEQFFSWIARLVSFQLVCKTPTPLSFWIAESLQPRYNPLPTSKNRLEHQ